MKDSQAHRDDLKLTARLKELIRDVPKYIDDASMDQKRRLLMLLEELRARDESKLSARLKELLKDVSKSVGDVPENQKRRLLMLLEDLQASDRRKHARKPCNIEVTLDGAFTDVVSNISAGGVFIETSVAFQPGKFVTLTFSSPNGEEPVKSMGHIVWNAPHGIGVRFTSMTKRLQEMIEDL